MRIYKIAQKGNIVKQDDPIFMMAPLKKKKKVDAC